MTGEQVQHEMSELKWIELIRVRSSAERLQEGMSSLVAQTQEIESSAEGAETFFLRHALYDGDLAVVVVWRNPSAPQKTRAGLMVAEQLQELGPVEHAVWVPAAKDATAVPEPTLGK